MKFRRIVIFLAWCLVLPGWNRNATAENFDTSFLSEFALPAVAGYPHSRAMQVAFSRDGKTLATGGFDLKTILWDVPGQKQLSVFDLNGCLLAVSPDGGSVATAIAGQKIRISSATNGAPQAVTKEQISIRSLMFSKDGSQIVVGFDNGQVRNFEAATGKLLRRFVAHKLSVNTIDCSPDGRLWATGSIDKTIAIWDAESGRELLRKDCGFLGEIKHVSFSPDGKLLVCGGDLCVLELATGNVAALLPNNIRGSQAGFLSDGHTLAITDKTHQIWNLAASEPGPGLGDFKSVMCVGVSHDGCLLAFAVNSQVVIWDVEKVGWNFPIPERNANPGELNALWDKLADAENAYRAVWEFAGNGERAIEFLGRRFPPLDQRQLSRWIADLDADEFDTREAATKHLSRAENAAVPLLRPALQKTQSQDVRKRIKAILSRYEARPELLVAEPEVLQTLRAITVLEQIGTPASLELLNRIAVGPYTKRESDDARTTHERLRLRNARIQARDAERIP